MKQSESFLKLYHPYRMDRFIWIPSRSPSHEVFSPSRTFWISSFRKNFFPSLGTHHGMLSIASCTLSHIDPTPIRERKKFMPPWLHIRLAVKQNSQKYTHIHGNLWPVVQSMLFWQASGSKMAWKSMTDFLVPPDHDGNLNSHQATTPNSLG